MPATKPSKPTSKDAPSAELSAARYALRIVIPLVIVGVLAYTLPVVALVHGLLAEETLLSLVNRDFVNYWMGGRMVLAGQHLDLFTQSTYFGYLTALFGSEYPIHNWGYPPHSLLLFWPLGFLEYRAGLVVFLFATFALFVAAVCVFRKTYAPQSNLTLLLLVIFSYAMMMVDTAQNGFLTSALLLLGLGLMHRSPMLAGLSFALLTIKPQLGLLIPVILLIDRNWTTIAWATAFSALLIVLSALVFGVESWQAYLSETITYQRYVMTNWSGIFLPMMPTVFGSARTLGYIPDTAYLAQWLTSAVGLGLVLWLLLTVRHRLAKAFAVCCGTFLVSPYGFNYDMGALAVCAALLLSSAHLQHRGGIAAIAVVAALPAAVMNLGRAGLPVTPILLALGLVAVLLQFRASAVEATPG